MSPRRKIRGGDKDSQFFPQRGCCGGCRTSCAQVLVIPAHLHCLSQLSWEWSWGWTKGPLSESRGKWLSSHEDPISSLTSQSVWPSFFYLLHAWPCAWPFLACHHGNEEKTASWRGCDPFTCVRIFTRCPAHLGWPRTNLGHSGWSIPTIPRR